MSSKDRRRSASYVGDVWLPHPTHGWLPAIATEGKAADAADVVIPPCALRKRIVPVEVGSVAADGLQPRGTLGDALESSVGDMTELTDVSEPSLMHNLYMRYCSDQIYTAIGHGILVSLNPYKRLSIYGDMERFRDGGGGGGKSSVAEPHIFAVVEHAYKEMVDLRADQALLMSGESGAGKTEASKLAMNYLVSASSRAGGSGARVAQRVAQLIVDSNPILEAFGNAKTFRNDNSSRFGKWVAMQFTPSGQVCGGKLTTYLLEGVRVTKQMRNER